MFLIFNKLCFFSLIIQIVSKQIDLFSFIKGPRGMPGERGRMGSQGVPVSCILPALYFKLLLIGK